MALTFHQADENIAYDWFTYVPSSVERADPAHIWVSGLHGNLATDDYASITVESRDQVTRFGLAQMAEQHSLILLVPVIPRPRSYQLYAVALPRGVFLDSADPFCRRPDLRVNAMVDRFSGELRDSGYDVRDGVFIDGFSAGAMFAQRYALLHPERVRAVAAGQCGGALTLPESRYGDTRLDWPLGVADLEALAGRPFDRDAYRRVPQYVYIGERDTDNSPLEEPGEVWPDQSSIDFLDSTFGGADPVRLANQVRYLRDRGYGEIAFRTYGGVGHDSRPMDPDVLAFFDAHK